MSRRWFVRIEWKPQDCWVGAFWKRNPFALDVWVCLLPMVPVHFGWTASIDGITPAAPEEADPQRWTPGADHADWLPAAPEDPS